MRSHSEVLSPTWPLWKGRRGPFPVPGAEPAGCGPPRVLTVARLEACLYNDVHHLLYVPPSEIFSLPRLLGNVLSANVNDSMIIRDRQTESWRWRVSNVLSKMVNVMTFRTALKAVGKNSKNVSSKIYKQDFSTM